MFFLKRFDDFSLDLVGGLPASFDNAAGAGIYDGGNATGLGVKGIMLGHGNVSSPENGWFHRY